MLVSEFMVGETENIVAKPLTIFRLTWNVFLLIKNVVFLAQTIGRTSETTVPVAKKMVSG
jgi:hypothetical protein